ncbi:hypothetical protein BDV97DRAFT_140351 [Delphinella strobiligena]|nr:hypothetical protein BDV97DRAFT_140351 [Delphinella strobiligena]
MLRDLPHSRDRPRESRNMHMHMHLPRLFRSPSSQSSPASTEGEGLFPGSDENFLTRAVTYSRTMHAHTSRQLNHDHATTKSPSQIRTTSDPASTREGLSSASSPSASPHHHTQRLEHDMAHLHLNQNQNLNPDAVMAIDETDTDEERMAENAVGATPCNTPEGKGVRRRRVTVGCGVRPGGLRAGGLKGVRVGEVVARNWAVLGG